MTPPDVTNKWHYDVTLTTDAVSDAPDRDPPGFHDRDPPGFRAEVPELPDRHPGSGIDPGGGRRDHAGGD
ncbi:hypothetical protein GCM10027615_33630 [Plantactinospora veratri]